MKKNKVQIADEILQVMIEKYTKKESSIKSATLEVLLKIREKVQQQDLGVIERVIILYGPEVKKIKKANKLKKFDIHNFIESIKDKVNILTHHEKERDNL